jgi:hypothetical protein
MLILMGFALRVYEINRVPLRGDEAFTVLNWMRQPLAVTIETIATKDPQPPLAYALYRAWALVFGSQDLIVRYLPALLNTLSIPAMYALARRLYGWRIGLLSAMIWAIHPFQVWHSQDARTYAIWAAFSLIAMWLGIRALNRGKRIDWLLYIGAAAIASYTYYLELFTMFVLTLYVIIAYWGQWKKIVQWIAAQAAVGVLLSPWFLQDRLLRSSGYGGTTGSNLHVEHLWERFIPTLMFGSSFPTDLMQGLWPLLVLILLAGLYVLGKQVGRRALLPALLGTIPLLLILLVSLKLNVFTPRYVLTASFAYVWLTAAVIAVLLKQHANIYRWFGLGLVGAVVLLSQWGLSNSWFVNDYAKAPDWRTFMAYLENHVEPNDVVLQTAGDAAFDFYFGDSSIEAPLDQLPGNERQPADEITARLANYAATRDRLWLTAQTFPDWPSAGIVEAWLAENMQPVFQSHLKGIRLHLYAPWDVNPNEAQNTPVAAYSGLVDVMGTEVYNLKTDEDALIVQMILRPVEQTANPLKAFVHLTGAVNPATGTPLWTQDDQLPQDGRADTTLWEVGHLYRDVYYLDLTGVPAGDYTLVAGFYDPSTGERVLVEGEDHFIVQSIHLD